VRPVWWAGLRFAVTIVPIQARERINPCAASRRYAATAVARDTDNRAASYRDGTDALPVGKASVPIRSYNCA
jgi:hypothetical protein